MLFIDTYVGLLESNLFCHTLLYSSLSQLMTSSFFFFFWFEVGRLVKLADFPGSSGGKRSAYNEEDPGTVLGWKDLLEKRSN